jgi:hypothetical protein
MNRKLIIALLAAGFLVGPGLLSVSAEARKKAPKKAVVEEDSYDDTTSSRADAEDEEEVRPSRRKKVEAADDEWADERQPRSKARKSVDEGESRSRRRSSEDEPEKKKRLLGAGFSLGLSYAYANLTDLNYIHPDAKKYYSYNWGDGLHSGLMGTLDVNFNIGSVLGIGPRFGYLGLPEVIRKYEYSYSTSGLSGYKYTYTSETKMTGSYTPLMFGLDVGTPGPVSVRLGLNAGYAWANVKMNSSYTEVRDYTSSSFADTRYTSSGSQGLETSGLVSEIRGSVRFGRAFHVALDGGYRFAKFGDCKFTEGSIKGETAKYQNTDGSVRNFELDFSGWNAGVKLGFNF